MLGYADTADEARRVLGYGVDPEADREMLEDYLFKAGRGTFDRVFCERLSHLLGKHRAAC